MICKQCGSKYKGDQCPHCNDDPFFGDFWVPPTPQAPPPPKVKPAPKKEPPPPKPISEPKLEEQEARFEQKPHKKKKSRALRPGKILLPTLMLFLPVAYFFVDVFVRFSDVLFVTDAAGSSLLLQFFTRLSSSGYEFNTLRDIKILTFGEDVALFESISFAASSAAGDMLIPLWIVLGLAIASAVSGLLILVSGGRILRSRVMADLLAAAGTGAAFSPLLGLLYVRMYHCMKGGHLAANLAAQKVGLSVEAALLIGIALCLMLPAIKALRRAAAGSRGPRVPVLVVCQLLGGRSVKATRRLAILFVVLALLLAAVLCMSPVLTSGSLVDYGEASEAFVSEIKTFALSMLSVITGKAADVNFMALVSACLAVVFLLQIPLMALCAVLLLCSLWQLIGVEKRDVVKKKRVRRALTHTGGRARRMLFVPYISYTAVQVLFVLVLLFGSKVVVHLDLSNITESLTLIYVVCAYVKSLCGTNTLYVFFLLGGAVLWHAAGNLSRKLIALSRAAEQE